MSLSKHLMHWKYIWGISLMFVCIVAVMFCIVFFLVNDVLYSFLWKMEIQKNRRLPNDLPNDWAFKIFKWERGWHWLWFYLREAMFMRVGFACFFRGPRGILLDMKVWTKRWKNNSYKKQEEDKIKKD